MSTVFFMVCKKIFGCRRREIPNLQSAGEPGQSGDMQMGYRQIAEQIGGCFGHCPLLRRKSYKAALRFCMGKGVCIAVPIQ